MGTLGKDFKYLKINEFLSKQEINLFTEYMIIRHRNNLNSFDSVQNNNRDTFFHGDPLFDSLLLTKTKTMEKHTNLKLFPTYSCWRMYSHAAVLEKHVDRPSCEVSVTIQINSDKPGEWPNYIENNAFNLKPGDAVIYLGTEVEHWREPLKSDWSSQVFLHYVNQDGKYKDHIWDKRNYLGEPKDGI